MSVFSNVFNDAALPVLAEQFAETQSATYRARGSPEVAVTIGRGPERVTEDPDHRSGRIKQRTQVVLLFTSVDLKLGAELEIESVTWAVLDFTVLPASADGFARLRLTRGGQLERTGQGYRR